VAPVAFLLLFNHCYQEILALYSRAQKR